MGAWLLAALKQFPPHVSDPPHPQSQSNPRRIYFYLMLDLAVDSSLGWCLGLRSYESWSNVCRILFWTSSTVVSRQKIAACMFPNSGPQSRDCSAKVGCHTVPCQSLQSSISFVVPMALILFQRLFSRFNGSARPAITSYQTTLTQLCQISALTPDLRKTHLFGPRWAKTPRR